MHYEVEVDGRLRRATVHRTSKGFIVEADGKAWAVDAARIDARTLSLLVQDLPPSPGTAPRAAGLESTGTTRSVVVTITSSSTPGQLAVSVDGTVVAVSPSVRGSRSGDDRHPSRGPQRIVAPMPGRVVRVLAAVGDDVRARQPVVVIEAMKMENELRAARDGVVVEVHAREGQSVEAGALLAVVAEATE